MKDQTPAGAGQNDSEEGPQTTENALAEIGTDQNWLKNNHYMPTK
jgi:hypothetical protein